MGPRTQDTRLWHPFSDMATVRDRELVITRGEDVWLWDEDGNRYLDAFASLWYTNIGHGRSEIADAVAAQMRELEAFTIFFDYANRPALELAELLAELSPMPGSRVMLTPGGGSEAIDTAVKMARRYWFEMGQPDRRHVVSRAHAYHGSNGIGTGIGGIDANRDGWGAALPETSRVGHDSVEALEGEIARVGADRIAAFVCEPVMGAGGVHPPPPGYIEGVAALCRAHDILFVCDSVICGFGRLGTWFGIERWNVEPDVITFAKGVTSGYLPLGGVLFGARVCEPFWSEPGRMVRHGYTFAGHPACCTAALANIAVIDREGLLDRALEIERDLTAVLRPLEDHPAVAEVRSGTGAMAAVELVEEGGAPGLMMRMRAAGVLVRASSPTAVAVCPPLTITREQVDTIGEAFAHSLGA
ncbi:aminotransferase family protein [Capillimicrobium parvum]|nr:aminotransferase class III-fold pyridoxal phosphate-dependent enzyme [Capillimicrobium parvum]